MIKMLFVLSFLFFSHVGSASNIQTQIHIKGNERTFYTGDIISVDIVLWPLSQEVENFGFLAGKKDEAIYLANVRNIRRSQNNERAVELSADMILLEGFAPGARFVEESRWGDISWNFPRIEYVFREFEHTEGAFFLEQLFKSDRSKWPLGITGILMGLLTFFVVKRLYRGHLKKKKYLEARRKNLSVFFSGDSRAEIEEVLKDYLKWQEYIIPDGFEAFKKKLLEIQYKKEWSDDEYEDVLSLLLKMRKEIKEKINGL